MEVRSDGWQWQVVVSFMEEIRARPDEISRTCNYSVMRCTISTMHLDRSHHAQPEYSFPGDRRKGSAISVAIIVADAFVICLEDT